MSGIIEIDKVKTYLLALQDKLSDELEELDTDQRFAEDAWERPQGGGGISRILERGAVFEKAGVNFSHVYGDRLPASASVNRPEVAGRNFQAMGVSAVIHPDNPNVPTSHMNVRFFLAEKPGAAPLWWFGGGFDLTPYYGFEEDAVHWHRTAAEACAPFGDGLYSHYKAACDDYFYLPHRQEMRGVGGLFFDDLNQLEQPDELDQFGRCFAFARSIGDHFLPAYLPILNRRKDMQYGERERGYQLYRRGRYVEFNLVYDRGTRYGLQARARTESILASLPPLAAWRYDYEPEPGSPEARLTSDFLVRRDWI